MVSDWLRLVQLPQATEKATTRAALPQRRMSPTVQENALIRLKITVRQLHGRLPHNVDQRASRILLRRRISPREWDSVQTRAASANRVKPNSSSRYGPDDAKLQAGIQWPKPVRWALWSNRCVDCGAVHRV